MTNVEKLKELGVYDKFVHNLLTLTTSIYDGSVDIDKYINGQRSEYLVTDAFTWKQTAEDEGQFFWSDVNDAMREEFNKD